MLFFLTMAAMRFPIYFPPTSSMSLSLATSEFWPEGDKKKRVPTHWAESLESFSSSPGVQPSLPLLALQLRSQQAETEEEEQAITEGKKVTEKKGKHEAIWQWLFFYPVFSSVTLVDRETRRRTAQPMVTAGQVGHAKQLLLEAEGQTFSRNEFGFESVPGTAAGSLTQQTGSEDRQKTNRCFNWRVCNPQALSRSSFAVPPCALFCNVDTKMTQRLWKICRVAKKYIIFFFRTYTSAKSAPGQYLV